MPNAGVKVVISAADRASQTIERINTRIARMQAPVRRVQAAFGRFASLSGLSRLNNGIVAVGRSAVGAFRSLGQIIPVLGTLTGAASVAGVYRLASAWAQVGTDLRTTSRTMGMAPQKLQAMQNAAKLAGGSAESMTGALQQLSQTRWAATHNQDPAAAAQFRAVGVSMKELQTLSPDKLFQRVAARLREIRNPAARAVAATTLFGAAAQGLMPILQQTDKEWDQTLNQARRYSHMTPAMVEAAYSLRRSQVALGESVEDFGYSIAEAAAPGVRELTDFITKLVEANRTWIAQDIGGYVHNFVTWLRAGGWKQIKGDITGVYQAVTNVVDRLGGWKSAGRDALIAIGALYALPVLAGLGSVATAVIAIATAFGRMKTAAGEAAAASRIAQTVGASPPGWNGVPSTAVNSRLRVPPGMLPGYLGIAYAGYEAYRHGALVSGEGEGVLDNIPGYSRFNRWWNHKSGADVAPLDQPIQQAAQALAKTYGIDADHFVALLRKEHGGYRNVSGAGAFGPSQLMPGTARDLGVADSINAPDYDWRKNLDAGARYYRQQLDRYHGNYAAADAAYNAGPNSSRVQQFAQTHDLSVLPRETQDYVATIDRLAQKRLQLASQPISPIFARLPPAVDPLDPGTDASVPDRYPSAPPMSVPSGAATGGTLEQALQRIQLEIDHKNAPPGTQSRVTKAPPGTRVVNRTPVQQAMPSALTSIGN